VLFVTSKSKPLGHLKKNASLSRQIIKSSQLSGFGKIPSFVQILLLFSVVLDHVGVVIVVLSVVVGVKPSVSVVDSIDVGSRVVVLGVGYQKTK